MNLRLLRLIDAVRSDAAVFNVLAFTGTSGATNTANMYVGLKPLNQRSASAQQVIGRIRKKLARDSGLSLYLQAQQDLRIGGRHANAEYQYTLVSDDLHLLTLWAPRLLARLHAIPELSDVNSDQQNAGLAADVRIDRDTASRLGLSTQTLDDTLYDAFGQREVSTMYTPLNQYFVVMEAAPQFWQDPQTLHAIHIGAPAMPVAAATPVVNASGELSVPAAPSADGSAAGASTYVAPLNANEIGGVQSAAGSSVSPLSATTSTTASLTGGLGFSTTAADAGAPGAAPAPLGGIASTDAGAATNSSGAGLSAAAAGAPSSSAPANGSTPIIGAPAPASVATFAAPMIPLDTIARLSDSTTPLAVNHQGQFPAVTISFNLSPGISLGQAVALIDRAEQDIHMPAEIRGAFAGTAESFQTSLANEPMLILAALLSVYIVLGILYESYVHPITILSTLPSAGIGALLALLICGIDLSVIALVGIILLIGIVKKNAILM